MIKWLYCRFVLFPLVKQNYEDRKKGILPDKWYWADEQLWDLGYYIKTNGSNSVLKSIK